VECNANAKRHTHCQVAQKSQPHKPKLVNKYVFASATNWTEKKAHTPNKVYKSLVNKWLSKIYRYK